MPKKVAFVSGPWRSNSAWGVKKNRLEAEQIAEWLWMHGYAAICPHKNSQDMDGLLGDNAFLEGTIEILTRCDLIVLNETHYQNGGLSRGTQAEILAAHEHRIPVYVFQNLSLVPLHMYLDKRAPIL